MGARSSSGGRILDLDSFWSSALSEQAYERLMHEWTTHPGLAGITTDDDAVAAMLFAGERPYLGSARLAVLAVYFELLEWIREDRAQGVDGDAMNKAEWACEFRLFIARLEECVAELERVQASILRATEVADAGPSASIENLHRAQAAEARAERAEQRRHEAIRDCAEQHELNNNEVVGADHLRP